MKTASARWRIRRAGCCWKPLSADRNSTSSLWMKISNLPAAMAVEAAGAAAMAKARAEAPERADPLPNAQERNRRFAARPGNPPSAQARGKRLSEPPPAKAAARRNRGIGKHQFRAALRGRMHFIASVPSRCCAIFLTFVSGTDSLPAIHAQAHAFL